MIIKNIHKLFIAVFATALFVPILAFGATFKTGENVFFTSGNTIEDNVYTAGESLSISSSIFGDLFATGGSILISEDVSEDIVAVGGNVTILGNSGGDVRVIGGDVLIAGDVDGELVVVGGTVTVSSTSLIEKDLIVIGGQISIDGDVIGDMSLKGETVFINGYVNGNVEVKTGSTLMIGEDAIIEGNVRYRAQSADALKMSGGAIIMGDIIFKEFKEIGFADTGDIRGLLFAVIGSLLLLKLIAFIITALIFVWLFRKFSNTLVSGIVRDPLQMLGKGFISLIIIPATSVALFVTVIGFPLGLAVMFSYGALILVTSIYAGIVAGTWASHILYKTDKAIITWGNVVGGVIGLSLVKFIPLAGWIIGFFIFLVTLGSITDIAHKKLWKKR